LTFCKAKIGSLVSDIPSSVGKKFEKKDGPSFPPVVMLAKVSAPALEEALVMRCVELLGKDRLLASNLLASILTLSKGSLCKVTWSVLMV
jgi:hypothetical protein